MIIGMDSWGRKPTGAGLTPFSPLTSLPWILVPFLASCSLGTGTVEQDAGEPRPMYDEPREAAATVGPEGSCGGPLETSSILGPEGGDVRLGQFRLEVQAGALDEEKEITLRRTPGDPDNPDLCTMRDTYTAEPFLLASKPDRPFHGQWDGAPDIDGSSGRLCPKISWTDDHSRLECYQLAAPSSYTIRSGNSVIDVNSVPCHGGERFMFFTDRLGYFRLLSRQEGGMPQRDKERFGHPRGSSPPEGCAEVPEIHFRIIILHKHQDGEIDWGDGAEITWQPYCNDNTDCDEDWFCERPRGRCEAFGICIPHTFPRQREREELDAPVCGCDGVTYANDAERRRHMVNLYSRGPCPEDSDGDSNEEDSTDRTNGSEAAED